ncbi:MAG TPA: hypothetical protein VEI82_04540 [Myxococcota bacterium]|nr:hypothetical protein [Myxococcota bacterium]
MRPLLLLSCVCLCLAGCAWVDFSEGQTVALDKIPDIVPGKTTKKEILDWFGAPQSLADAQFFEDYLIDRRLTAGPVLDLPFADVLVFRLTKGQIRGLILILFNWLDVRVASDTLIVFFDENDRVLYYGFRRGTDELRH